MALKQEDLFKLDLYELLGLETSCAVQDVKKAFRKRALKCHPDKNPDDPNAAQLFHQLSCALEILTDSSARAAYDKVLNGRKAAKIRNQQLDSRIKKLKEDLEERERNASNGSSFVNDEKKLKAEVERLRKEGSRLLQEEITRIQEEVKSNQYCKEKAKESFVLTVRWQAEKSDPDNGGYNYTVLHNLLSKYGDILTLLVSPKKKGRAVVEFRTWDAAEKASQLEKGLPNKPLTFERVGGPCPTNPSTETAEAPKEQGQAPRRNVFPFANRPQSESKARQTNFPSWPSDSSRLNDDELERAVLEKLHQRERMKRSAEGEGAD